MQYMPRQVLGLWLSRCMNWLLQKPLAKKETPKLPTARKSCTRQLTQLEGNASLKLTHREETGPETFPFPFPFPLVDLLLSVLNVPMPILSPLVMKTNFGRD